MIKKILTLLSITLILALSSSAFAKNSPRKTYVHTEMNLMNRYLKAIQIELKRIEPRTAELYVLSQLILDTAYQIRTSKNDLLFHQDFQAVINDVKMLHKYSKKNNYSAALSQAQSIKNNCNRCHESPKFTKRKTSIPLKPIH